MRTMKAAVRDIYGGPEVLSIKDVEIPTPATNEVLVKIHFATVNRTDCHVLAGTPFIFRFFIGLFRPKLSITGTDFSGEIVAVGNSVTKFTVGDRVFGLNDEGLPSHAEFMSIHEEANLVKITDHISYAHAAASAEGPHYALNFLNKIKLKKGDKVLVNGATGGIGSAAIQLLKLKGAIVTAVCDTKNLALIKSKGVDRVINYEEEDFTELEEKFHFVLDAVGKSRFKLCKRILTSNGIYVSSELGPRAENLFLSLKGLLSKKKKVVFPIPTKPKDSLIYMAGLLDKHQYEPLIDRIYPIENIREAFKYVAQGMKTGNVLIKMTES